MARLVPALAPPPPPSTPSHSGSRDEDRVLTWGTNIQGNPLENTRRPPEVTHARAASTLPPLRRPPGAGIAPQPPHQIRISSRLRLPLTLYCPQVRSTPRHLIRIFHLNPVEQLARGTVSAVACVSTPLEAQPWNGPTTGGAPCHLIKSLPPQPQAPLHATTAAAPPHQVCRAKSICASMCATADRTASSPRAREP